MIILLSFNLPFGVTGVTIFPWIFISRFVHFSGSSPATWNALEYAAVLRHETCHYEQIKKWYDCLWVLGIIAWWACYLLLLPIGWNPWRRKWEREAYAAGQNLTAEETDVVLRNAPYWL